MTQEQIIKYLLEDSLGLIKESAYYLIINEVTSVEDPEFDQMVKYYTRYEAPKGRFKSLSDAEKLFVINTVDAVVNGSKKRIKHPTDSNPNPAQQAIITILASEYVRPNEEVEGWSPNYVDTQNIFEFILTFYNPYTPSGTLSFVAYKAIPDSFDKLKTPIDLVLEAFKSSIEELLVDKKYNPDLAPFDFSFVQQAWRNDIMDITKKVSRRKDINVDPMVKSSEGGEEGEEYLDLTTQHGEADPEFSLKSDKQKFDYILDQFNETEQKVLKGFFNFIFSETPSTEQASKKLIDTLYDNDGDITKIEDEDLVSGSKESMYDYIGKELGIEYNEASESNLKSKVAKIRPKLLSLFRDPKFKEMMGIEDWSEKDLDILKGTGTKGHEWKKTDSGYEEYEKEYLPKSGVAYDEFGKPLPTDEKGRIIPKSKRNISELMFECVNNILNNFNYRFSKYDGTLDKILFLNKSINEGYDIALKDLDQDIYNYINNTVDGLDKANYMLNELEIVSDDIKYDYPEVSEKLHESIEPLIEELENLINKVKSVKNNLRPFLSESSKKKDDDELEEERITNPDSKEFVKRRENFIGSHIYGEDLGGLGKMYVAYSYGEQFPVYLWFDGKWYHNTSNYVLDDGTVNEPTIQHKEDMRPAQDTHGLSTFALNTMISKFKKKNGLGDNVHTDVEPGEKN